MGERKLIKADDLVRELEISKPLAYKLIATMNKELKDKGYMIISGKVPEAYYNERFFFGTQASQRLREVGN